MLKVLKMKIPYIISFLLFYVVFEILTYSYIGMYGLAKYFLLDLFIVLSFSTIVFLFKSNKVTISILSVIMFLFMILFLANTHIYLIFGDVFSLEYLKVLDEANKVFSFSFLNYGVIMLGIFVYVIYVLLNVFIYKLNNNVKYDLERNFIVSGFFTALLTSLIIGILFNIGVNVADNNIYVNGQKISDESYVKTITKKAFKYYGILGLYYKELEVGNRKKEEIVTVASYLSESKYEGLLKNKNVITIMGETLQSFAICKELTPNLYKLQEEGINFSNNYSVNKTNVSEMIGITGSNYPFYDAEYKVDFSIPNVLNDTYKTTYAHDNNTSFYGRGNLVRYYGFENSYFHDDLYDPDFKNEVYPTGLIGWENNDWHWSGDYTLDSVTMEQALPYLVSEDERFYSFFTSLSMHGPYNLSYGGNLRLFDRLGYLQKVRNAITDNKWVNPLKNVVGYEEYLVFYECAVMDFDRAIGKLLAYLENKDLLDDTLLVIYGDHEAYYHDIYLKMANTTDISQVDKLYSTTLIMYNKTLNDRYYNDNGTHYEKTFSSPLTVAPTILDLLGVKFNKDAYVNYSIFDNRYLKAFYSYQQKAFMDNNFYSEDLETFKYVSDPSIDSKTFLEDANKLRDRIEYTKMLYEKSIVDE